ncbi:redox-sensitive transcriptional activator SoxR [Mycetocola spongiae]|uniref:redox-sensitive transcriptional activator SoxR n=1 Tax=Mycetocola spongiae TaxID=2859226 RepID=UPI001CF3812D|nr:redox-sensitive transcriptional activator SoxR [Mycetocola spongiae]UCR89752.1 redox-sensitive transcriptional activator SoxR [Mycetocola spongiae]
MRDKNDLLSIGEVARRSGAAVSAVRYYEDIGLLPAERGAGNARLFRRHVLRRISLIQIASRLGISLADVAEVFATLPAHKPPTQADWERISLGWQEQLARRAAMLERMRAELTGCLGCGCLSADHCTLLNPQDRLGQEGPGARRVELDPNLGTP